MCGYYCAYFCGVMFKDKNFIDFTNLFSPYDFKKNDEIVLDYFKGTNPSDM